MYDASHTPWGWVHRTRGEPTEKKKNTHPKNPTLFFREQETSKILKKMHRLWLAKKIRDKYNNPRLRAMMFEKLSASVWYAASRAVQFHPPGGQSDFVWLPARTPHGAYVW